MLNKLYRSGCSPRTIFFSQSSKGHECNYGNPVLTITGKNSRHIIPSSSKERKLLDRIKYKPQPNSKRTLIPNYEKISIKNNNISKIYYTTMDNLFYDKVPNKQKSLIKTSKIKNKTSNDLLNNFRENSDNLNNFWQYNNKFSFCIKNKYDYSSEILTLPGGHKRDINDINDDYTKNASKKKNINSTINCFKDRNINSSNIDCLCPSLKQKLNRPYSLYFFKRTYKSPLHNIVLRKCSHLFYSSNSIFYNNIYNNSRNNIYYSKCIKDSENIKSGYTKENGKEKNVNYLKVNNLKRKPNKIILNNKGIKNVLINEYPFKTETNSNLEIYQPINNKNITPNIFNNIYKEKTNGLITNYTKRKNIDSFNKLFNEVHHQPNNYSLINKYGKNYSKKNYSQIELH